MRPPLVRGTFCEVELRGAVRAGQHVVPRSAIHDGAVYILDGDNRMRRQPVAVRFVQSDFAVIDTELSDGTPVVVSDPTPAIDGQLVQPIQAEDALDALVGQASAESTLR